jgi:aminoglycoside N3'-acetyltransferase
MRIWLPEGLKRVARGTLAALHARRRTAELERTERHVSRAELVAGLRGLGVEPGDTLFVHSSLKSLGFVEGGPASVIAALQEAVSPGGTLLLPTYYVPGGTILATCEMKDYVFDKRVHGTNMGALPTQFLATPGVQRSIHPTHSVSALGRHARHLTDSHHLAPSVFGVGSPWQRFVELPQAKVLGLGISMGPVTFYHLLEDSMGNRFPVPVWLDKTYPMPCIDEDGQPCSVPVRAFDPVIAERRIDHKPRDDLRAFFAAELERAGLKRNGLVGQAASWIIAGRPFLDHLHALALRGITIYSTADKLRAAMSPPLSA